MTTTEAAVIVASFVQFKEWHQPVESRLLCVRCALEHRHQIIDEERLSRPALVAMFGGDVECDNCWAPLAPEEDDQDDE